MLLYLLLPRPLSISRYAEADRHGGLVGGFPRYLALWGCPLGWAAGAGGAARWAAAVVEVTAAYNLAVAVTYDHRMLACGAVTILHITLLCSMALCGDLDLGTAGARPAAGSAAGALGVDGVVVTLALESMMIQMLGGALVLMGLKQVGLYREPRSILGYHRALDIYILGLRCESPSQNRHGCCIAAVPWHRRCSLREHVRRLG